MSGAIEEAEALQSGRFRYFSWKEGKLGFPHAEWHSNPFSGQCTSADQHWCDLSDFETTRGDIKFIWEPSRFAWAYALARAFASNPKEEYAEAFWLLLESWMDTNPPQMGPNWMCGQEIAFRVMACTFASAVFWNSPSTTSERLARLVVMLAASAERIAGNIKAARNQRGNHAVSEAAGLWTVGVLFPELRNAGKWEKLGRYVLEDEVSQHNFSDGSYVQHSMNYQRLMLHDYVWCLRLAELNNIPFSEKTRQAMADSCLFLYQLQDDKTGRLPNYGPNDGALILPLSNSEYSDYRPVIGAVHYLSAQERLYEEGPWLEELIWFFGHEALQVPICPAIRASQSFLTGGYFTMRGVDSWGMVRCHSFRSRPNQADMLHLDLWWKGINLFRDSGTFSYYDPKEHWERYFASTAAHNTITVGNTDQMIKGDRFRWYSLVQSKFIAHSRCDGIEFWQGEHYGYNRLKSRTTHRRTICRIDDQMWMIIDDILGQNDEAVTLHWHMPDFKYIVVNNNIELETPHGQCGVWIGSQADKMLLHIARGSEEPGPRMGWESRYYGKRKEALSIQSQVRAMLPTRFVTLVSLGATIVVVDAQLDSRIVWQYDGRTFVSVELDPPRRRSGVIGSIRRNGKTPWSPVKSTGFKVN